MSGVFAGLIGSFKAAVISLVTLRGLVFNSGQDYSGLSRNFMDSSTGVIYTLIPDAYSVSFFSRDSSNALITSRATSARVIAGSSSAFPGSAYYAILFKGNFFTSGWVTDPSTGGAMPAWVKYNSSGVLQASQYLAQADFGKPTVCAVTSGGNDYLFTLDPQYTKGGTYTYLTTKNMTNFANVSAKAYSTRDTSFYYCNSSGLDNKVYLRGSLGYPTSYVTIHQVTVAADGTIGNEPTGLSLIVGRNLGWSKTQLFVDSSGYVYFWYENFSDGVTLVKIDFSVASSPTIVWAVKLTASAGMPAITQLRDIGWKFDSNGDLVVMANYYSSSVVTPVGTGSGIQSTLLKIVNTNTSTPTVAWTKKVSYTNNVGGVPSAVPISAFEASNSMTEILNASSTVITIAHQFNPDAAAFGSYTSGVFQFKNSNSNYSFTTSNTGTTTTTVTVDNFSDAGWSLTPVTISFFGTGGVVTTSGMSGYGTFLTPTVTTPTLTQTGFTNDV